MMVAITLIQTLIDTTAWESQSVKVLERTLRLGYRLLIKVLDF